MSYYYLQQPCHLVLWKNHVILFFERTMSSCSLEELCHLVLWKNHVILFFERTMSSCYLFAAGEASPATPNTKMRLSAANMMCSIRMLSQLHHSYLQRWSTLKTGQCTKSYSFPSIIQPSVRNLSRYHCEVV